MFFLFVNKNNYEIYIKVTNNMCPINTINTN